jgi:hypothetical protein
MSAQMNKERNSEKYFNLKKQFLYFYPTRKKSSPPNFREDNDGEDKKKTNSGSDFILAGSRPGSAL